MRTTIPQHFRQAAAAHGIPVRHDPPTARALHASVKIGEPIRPDHYRAVAAAIVSDDQGRLDRTATDSFLLLATHLRDGRTPNAARKQWFMTDSDADHMPLVSMLTAASCQPATSCSSARKIS